MRVSLDGRSLWLIAGSGTIALTPIAMPVAIAAEYLSIVQAQRSIFPLAQRFDEVTLQLTAEQQHTIASLAGPQPRHGTLRIWRVQAADRMLGYYFVDEVIGRQDLITYAAGIDTEGKLSALEILAYRESHGGEIRSSAWRAQFKGRAALSNLGFQTDIKNIAGATMSCQHVTQGVRWLHALWETALRSA